MENKISKTIRICGGIVLIAGIIGSFFLGMVFPVVTYGELEYLRIEESYNWGLTLSVLASSILTGLLFLGIAEIIRLLDNAVKILGDFQLGNGKTGIDNVLKDIESNLPKL